MKVAIVELHDVTPYFEKEISFALECFSAWGVENFSLLFIPNFWNKVSLEKRRDFVEFIKSKGQEIILHGYNHRGGRLRDLLWTSWEGEFSGLKPSQIRAKISRALEILDQLALKPKVFIPPAWIGGQALEEVLKEYEFEGVSYRFAIKDLRTKDTYFSPVISLSSRKVLEKMSLFLSPSLFMIFKNFKILRLALHAKDFQDPKKVQFWKKLLIELKKTRRLISYEEFLMQGRLTSAFLRFS